MWLWLCDAGHDCPEHQHCAYSIFLITLCVARGQTVRAGTGEAAAKFPAPGGNTKYK